MEKKLSEMSLEELWKLFPICLTEHQPYWKDWYTDEENFLQSGYICMSETSDRISFNKGYTEKGFAERVFHLHLRYLGDNEELYFRDYLIEHTEIASEYEEMKLKLWKEYEFNRDGYTNAKTDFIQKYTEKAKLEYGARY